MTQPPECRDEHCTRPAFEDTDLCILHAPPPKTGFDLLIAEILRNPNDPPTHIRICGVEYVRPRT